MSVNAVDETTGNTTPLAGNTNNLVGNLSALTTNTKSDAVGAINEVNQTKQNATDNNLQTTDKTIVGGINELVSGLTNVIAKSMFGGYSTYYRTTQTTIDDIIDTGITAPQTDDAGYFSCENRGTIVGYGVRQFVFGWINTTKLFAWIVVCSYDGIYVGRRANTSTFTITKLSD